MSETCEWYHEIGSGYCDNCGLLPTAHKGTLVLKKGAGPFGSPDEDIWDKLTWAEWKDRVEDGKLANEVRKWFALLDDKEAIRIWGEYHEVKGE